MISDYSRDLLRSGIIELKAGNRDTARRYLDRALYMAGDHDVLAEAWFWMSELASSPVEKRQALENCLSHDLHHARARRALAVLDGKLKPEEIVDAENPLRPSGTLQSTPVAEQKGSPKSAMGQENVSGSGLGGFGGGRVGVDAQRFMCPKCGGRMTYSPDGQSLVCEYCTRRQKLGPMSLRASDSERGNLASNEDFLIAMATARGHGKPLNEQVLQCQGCGAAFILPPGQLSLTCLYCGSPHVIRLDESRGLLAPEGIIPHAFNAARAASLLKDWMLEGVGAGQTRGPAPTVNGLYLPIWTFDIGGAIDYTGEMIEEQDTGLGRRAPQYVRLDDSYPVMLSDLPIPASRKLSAPFVRLLSTFDLKAVQPYDPRYLADWPAELYDIPMDEASLDARSQGFALLKRDMLNRIAPVRLISASSANMTIESFRLDLLPVWMAEIQTPSPSGEGRSEGALIESHLVLINGENGAVEGDLNPKPAGASSGLLEWLWELGIR